MKKNSITTKKCGQILEFIEQLRHEVYLKGMEQREIEEKVDKFLENEEEKSSTIPYLLRIMTECQNNSGKLLFLTLMLSRCYSDKALPLLIKYGQSPDVSDKVRKKLILLLDRHGEIPKVGELVRSFKNKQYLAEHALQSMLGCIGPSGEDKNNLFRHFADRSPAFYNSLIQELSNLSAEQAMWILGALAEYPEEKVAKAAIAALGKKESSLACEILENLLVPGNELDQCRKNALKTYKLAGMQKSYQRLYTPHKCYLSEIDGNGHRILLISQRSGRRMAMVTFMLSEEEGLQDCSFLADISTFEMESVIKSLEKELGLKQVDYAMGIRVLEDGLWIILHKKKILPPSFLAVRRILRDQKLVPRPYTVNMERLGIETVEKRLNALLESSNKLLQESPFSEWCLDTKSCHEFVKGRPSILNGHKVRKGTLSQFIKAVLESNRSVWERRFLLIADFLYQLSPRSYREKIDICLALHLAIKKEMPLNSIPFMVELAENTIEQIRDKVDSDAEPKVCEEH